MLFPSNVNYSFALNCQTFTSGTLGNIFQKVTNNKMKICRRIGRYVGG